MNIFKQTLTALALSVAALGAAMATPMVKEYNTVGWNQADGVQNTVNAVGGMSYGGHVANMASLAASELDLTAEDVFDLGLLEEVYEENPDLKG